MSQQIGISIQESMSNRPWISNSRVTIKPKKACQTHNGHQLQNACQIRSGYQTQHEYQTQNEDTTQGEYEIQK